MHLSEFCEAGSNKVELRVLLRVISVRTACIHFSYIYIFYHFT